MKEVYFHIRRSRELKGYTQEYVAIQLEISQRTYSKIESGIINISIERFFFLVKLLEINIEPILKERNIASLKEKQCDNCIFPKQLLVMNELTQQKSSYIQFLQKLIENKY